MPPPLAICLAEAIDGHEAARSALECQIERSEMMLACNQEAGCEGDAYACEEAVWQLEESDPCPELPFEVEVAITEACLGYTPIAPFTCGDGTEIPGNWECDGFPDCEDGSDEHPECPNYMPPFVCDDGTEIPGIWECDGQPDCADGSDEASC